MRKTLIITAFSLLAFLVQLLFGSWMTIREIRPDFLLIVVMFIGRNEGKVGGQIYGFLIGLIADMIGLSSFLGLSALSKTVAGFGAGLLRKRRNRLNPVIFHGVEVLILVIHFSIIYMINFNTIDVSAQMIFFQYILPSVLYTGLFYFLFQYFLPQASE